MLLYIFLNLFDIFKVICLILINMYLFRDVRRTCLDDEEIVYNICEGLQFSWKKCLKI